MKRYNKKNILGKYLIDNHGVVSIFLCLMLLVLIPLLFSIIELTRFNAMKIQVECATDMSMDSVLSEYNQELLSQYGLLFIDTAYSNDAGSLDNTVEHLSFYMDNNLSAEQGLLSEGSRDLFGLNCDEINITCVSRATDNHGEVFRHLAVSYMLEYFGYSYIESVNDIITEVNNTDILNSDISDNYNSSQNDLENYDYEANADEGTEFEDVEDIKIDNPSDSINQTTAIGILSLVLDEASVSTKSIDLDKCISRRDLVAGNGMNPAWPVYNSVADELLFNEYIMLMFGNYSKEKEDSYLQYEIEYIISGKDNDYDNLNSIVNNLLLIRGGANALTFFQSASLQAQSSSLAVSLSAIFPPAEPVVCAVINAAWIFAESVYDVRIILNKGKIPLIKKTSEWNISLDDAIYFFADLFSNSQTDYSEKDTGLSYEDYLRILLYITDSESKTIRSMDIIELNINQKNENFRLDNCIASLTVQMIIESDYGYTFLVTKDFGYW